MNVIPTRVLLIEDNPGDARLIEEMLAEAGGSPFELERAERLDTGLELLSQDRFDVALLDLGLPDSRGLDTLRRALSRAPDIPLVVLTGLEDEAVGLEAVGEGAQDYLVKGKVGPELLSRSILYAKERKQSQEALKHSEEHFRSLIENGLDLITLLNADGTIRYESPSIENILGYKREELLGKNVFEYVHPDDVGPIVETFSRGIQTPGALEYVKYRFRHKDGSWRDFESIGNNLIEDPHIRGVVVNSRDITDRIRLEEQVKASEEYHRALIEHSMDLVIVLNEDASIRYVSPSVEQILQYKPEEVTGDNIFDYIHPEDASYPMQLFEAAINNPGKPYHIECRAMHRNGIWRFIETIGVNYLNNPYIRGFVLNSRHVTERKRLEEALRDMSHTDEITGLNNRRGFFTLAQQYQKIARRQEQRYAILYADLDGLKNINDTYGHDMGTEALIETAAVLKDIFRESDIIARFGGDEFVVLVAGAFQDQMDRVLGRFQKVVDTRNQNKGRPYSLSISTGVSFFDPSRPESLDELIARADAAMYEEKRRKIRSEPR